MCKSPGIGATLDEHDRRERNRRLNQEFKKLAPASEAELRDQVALLEQEVADLKLQLSAERKDRLQIQLETLLDPTIHSTMKAGCTGEFVVDVEGVCPECWNSGEDDEICSLCDNESDENGIYNYSVDVPWTTQKQIFKMMCKYKAIALEEEAERGNYE